MSSVGVERAAGEVERAAGAQSSAAWPKTGSAKVMLGEVRARASVDRHRQLGQREGLRLGGRQLARRLRRRVGAAQPVDALGARAG